MLKVTAVVSKFTNRHSLVQGNDYQVIGIDDSCFRIVDEAGEPTLYPHDYFLDSSIKPPKHWVFQQYDENQYTYDPPELSRRGFYEDYADGREDAIEAYRQYLHNKRS